MFASDDGLDVITRYSWLPDKFKLLSFCVDVDVFDRGDNGRFMGDGGGSMGLDNVSDDGGDDGRMSIFGVW